MVLNHRIDHLGFPKLTNLGLADQIGGGSVGGIKRIDWGVRYLPLSQDRLLTIGVGGCVTTECFQDGIQVENEPIAAVS